MERDAKYFQDLKVFRQEAKTLLQEVGLEHVTLDTPFGMDRSIFWEEGRGYDGDEGGSSCVSGDTRYRTIYNILDKTVTQMCYYSSGYGDGGTTVMQEHCSCNDAPDMLKARFDILADVAKRAKQKVENKK